MPKAPRTPYDVKLTDEKREDLAQFLSRAIEDGQMARSVSDTDVEYFHTIYEQGRTRSNPPWPDAADLTSAIGTEKVDALRARIVRTVMTDQVFTVEGWGDSAKKAPFVEEYLQWQLESVGFQQVFARAVHLSLIEPKGVLELYEDRIKRPIRKDINAVLKVNPADGSALVDASDPAKPKPVYEMKPDGTYLEAQTPEQPQAALTVDSYEWVTNGPRPRTIAYRDYLQLPAHAQCREQVWGHAKRFYRTLADLKERATQGIYDAAAVDDLGTSNDRSSATTISGQPLPALESPEPDLHEKELWEVTFLRSLDKTGQRWYVATVHVQTRTILRIQHDDIGRPRYFPLVPFPRPDSTDGYSFVGHKLITVIEEDTAWRNMTADHAAKVIQTPMLRLSGALWDPDDQPIGPRAVIDVRDMREIQVLQMPDYSSPAVERLNACERTAEKLAGITDVAAGVTQQEKRTLGEVQQTLEQSFVRMDEAIKNIQEALEEFAQVFIIMSRRRLAEMQDGMELPASFLTGLELRGANILEYSPSKKLTATLLDGAFKCKPKGSTETADRNRMRADFNQSLQAIAALAGSNPMIAAILQTPEAAKAQLEQWVRLYNVSDKQAFLGPTAQAAMQAVIAQQQMQQQMVQMGALQPPPGKPGLPPQGPRAQLTAAPPPQQGAAA